MIPCQLIQFRYVKYHIFTHQFSTILRDKPVIIASPIFIFDEKERTNKVLVVPHPFRDLFVPRLIVVTAIQIGRKRARRVVQQSNFSLGKQWQSREDSVYLGKGEEEILFLF